MAIPQDYIAELTRRTDITELVRSYVELKRNGRMEKGLCPFHNEKTPSFYVYPETDSFYCFGCGAGGDAITFVKNIQSLSYVEAIKFLAARAGMPMPDEDDTQAKQRNRLLSINREAARFYAAALNTQQGAQARSYLRGRKLEDKTIRGFGLGYAPAEFGSLLEHLKRQGFSEDELVSAGVCKRSERGGLYDAFRDRIVFPIIDLRGNVIAFGGRMMGEGRGPKYLNSADTPMFKKSRNLFALNIARKSTSKRMILTEGYMDTISLHQAGFDTAIATLGTALTAEQAKLISNYASEAVICYDSDEAGQRATARAINLFRSTPVNVRVLTLNDAKDPDEFIHKYGPQRFAQLLDGSGNTIEYALAQVQKQYELGSPDGRAGYIREALELLARQASPVEQDIYAGRIAEQTDVAKAAILTQLDGVMRQHNSKARKEREKRLKDETAAAAINLPYGAGGKALKVAFAEQQLLAAMLKDAEKYVPMVCEKVRPEHMVVPEMAEAYAVILDKYKRQEYIELSALGEYVSEKVMAMLGRALAQNYEFGFTQQDVETYIGRLLEGYAASKNKSEMSAQELMQYVAQRGEQKGRRQANTTSEE